MKTRLALTALLALVLSGCASLASFREPFVAPGRALSIAWRRQLTDSLERAFNSENDLNGGNPVVTFQHLLETNPSVAARLVQQLVRRLYDAEEQIEILMLRDAQSKIVSAVIKSAQQAQAQGTARADGTVRIALSPMELSSRVGLDVDGVKRGVQRLRDAQYVRIIDEQLEILDLDALRRLYALLGTKDEIRGAELDAPTTK